MTTNNFSYVEQI